MHSLIDAQLVELIRKTGATFPGAPDRKAILEQHGLPYDQPAENVVVTGCQILPGLPHVIAALSRVLTRAGFSHTFLSEEICCGNNVYRPAIKARDAGALAECQALSREFLSRNLAQARGLGARRLVIFCSPCYPIYKHAFPEEDIVFYPTALDECLAPVDRDAAVDYYAGCYRLHKKFAPVSMDLAGVNRIFAKVRGLSVNKISAPQCCYKPEGAAHMMHGVKTSTMIHVCTGCYVQALVNASLAQSPENLSIRMLPEFVEEVWG